MQIEQAKAEADKKKGEMSSLESELQRANARACELEEEARRARCMLPQQMHSARCIPRVTCMASELGGLPCSLLLRSFTMQEQLENLQDM